MCALTENTDMAQDVLDRVSCLTSFLEEVLQQGSPGHGLELSEEAATGLLYVVRDIGSAVQSAAELGK